jgi:hypothetical protein
MSPQGPSRAELHWAEVYADVAGWPGRPAGSFSGGRRGPVEVPRSSPESSSGMRAADIGAHFSVALRFSRFVSTGMLHFSLLCILDMQIYSKLYIKLCGNVPEVNLYLFLLGGPFRPLGTVAVAC